VILTDSTPSGVGELLLDFYSYQKPLRFLILGAKIVNGSLVRKPNFCIEMQAQSFLLGHHAVTFN